MFESRDSHKKQQELLEMERALIDPIVRRSRSLVSDLLHEDFTETGSSGRVYGRDEMIEMMVSETPGEVIVRDFDVTYLSDEVALVTYRSIGTSGQEARRSSIWVREDDRWRLRHHQGTKVPDRWSQSAVL
jgi:ribonuclease HI